MIYFVFVSYVSDVICVDVLSLFLIRILLLYYVSLVKGVDQLWDYIPSLFDVDEVAIEHDQNKVIDHFSHTKCNG